MKKTHRRLVSLGPVAPLAPLVIAGLVVVAAACSSSSESSGGGGDASTHDPAKNCVKPGTASNAKGVGGYCETGNDCNRSFCSALFGAPDNAWFCTVPCKTDDDCGEGAACVTDPRGVACVPLVCGGVRHPADASASSDASSSDASDAASASDASNDAPTDASSGG